MQRPALTKTPAETSRAAISHYVVLAAIVLVGIALRTFAIGRESLWGDEALTLMLARLPAFDLLFRPVDPTPGLYYVLHKLLLPEMVGTELARLPALIFGVLTIPAGYWLGKAAIDRIAGLAVAALVAVSPPLVDFSQEARAYSLLVLLITLSAAGLIDAFPANGRSTSVPPVRWGRLSIFVLTGTLAIYCHLIGWFWMGPALLLALIMAYRRKIATRWQIVGAICLFALIVTPEAVRLAGYYVSPVNEFAWLKQANALVFFDIVQRVTLPWSTVRALQLLPAESAFALNLLRDAAILIWAIAAIRGNIPRIWAAAQRRAVALSVSLILLSMPLTIWLAGYVLTPLFLVRTALPMSAGFFLVVAALAHLKGKSRAILVVVMLYAASAAATGLTRAKEQWAEAARLVAAHSADGTMVLFCPAWRGAAFLHAADQGEASHAQMLIFREGTARQVSTRLGRDRRWADRYVNLALRPVTPAYHSEPTVGRGAWWKGPPAEVMIVRSQCSANEEKRIKAWLGAGEESLLGRAPAVLDYPAIEVSRFRPARDRPRPVLVDGSPRN